MSSKTYELYSQQKIYLATFATLTVLPADLWEIKEKGNPDINNLWRYDFLRLHESPDTCLDISTIFG
ncbi:MAG: hypothetical protein IPG79_02415 [Saprospiraceae bacterium]|nr:hypothetical protein [Saprospiraceae bacterium]